QREVFARGQRLDARGELVQPRQRVAPRFLILFLRRRLARAHRGVGLLILRGDRRIDREVVRDIGPLAADDRELPARCRRVFEQRGAGRFVGELGEARLTPFRVALRLGVRRFAPGAFVGLLRRAPFGRGRRLGALTFGGFGLGPLRRPLTLGRVARALRLFERARLGRTGRRRVLLRGHTRRLGGLALGRLALVDLADDGTRALGGRLALRAVRDLLELAAIGHALHGRQRGLAELAVQRDADDLVVILQRVERRAPHRLLIRVLRNRPQHARIALVDDARQRADRGRFARRALRDGGEGADVADRVDRRQALGFANPLERLERDVAQHRGGVGAHALVRVAGRNRRQRGRVEQFRDRRAADAGIGILARDLGEQRVLGQRNLLHERQANRWILVVLPRLCAKPIK